MGDFCIVFRPDKDNFIKLSSEKETIVPMVSLQLGSYGHTGYMLMNRAEFLEFAATVREAEAVVRGEAQP